MICSSDIAVIARFLAETGQNAYYYPGRPVKSTTCLTPWATGG